MGRVVYLIPNFYKGGVDSSQGHLLKKYYSLLRKEYRTIILYPEVGEEYNKFVGADEYVILPIKRKNYPQYLHTEYVKYLTRKASNQDVIYTFQSINAFQLKTALYYPPYKYPKVINHFIENLADYSENDCRYLQRLIGFVNLPTILNSTATKRAIERVLPKFFSLSMINEAKYYEVNIGIDFEKIRKYKSDEKNDVFTWVFAGNSILPFKRLDKIMRVFDRLYSYGYKFRVKFYVIEHFIKKIPNRPYLSVYKSLSQEGFWREASKCNAFLCASDFETYGSAYWELLELGLVGIFYEKEWIRDLFPNYPFKIKSLADAISMCIATMKNYNGIRRKVLEKWSMDRKNHDSFYLDKKYLDVVRSIINDFFKI